MQRMFLALLLILPLSYCSEYPSGVAELGFSMVPQGAAFSIQNFTFKNNSAYALVLGSEVHAIILEGSFFGPNAMTDKKELEGALFAYELSNGFDPNALSLLLLVHHGIDGIEDDKDAGEAECRRLLGTDRFPCDSFESCRMACFATPFCPHFAYGGEPGEFIYVIWDYENDSAALDVAYDLEEDAYGKYLKNKSIETTEAYLATLSNLNRMATQVATTKLHDYSFCFTPDYSLPAITSLQLQAQMLYKNASRFFNLSSYAEKVQNRTLVGLERKREAELQKLLSAPNATESAQEENISDEAGEESAPSTRDSDGALLIAAITLAVLLAGSFIAYLALRQRKKKGGLAGK